MISKRMIGTALVALCTTVISWMCSGDSSDGKGKGLSFNLLGTFSAGTFNADGGVMEITAFDPTTDRLYAINGVAGNVLVLDLSDPAAISSALPEQTLNVVTDTGLTGGPSSVAVKNGILAVAVQNAAKNAAGGVALYDATTAPVFYMGMITVGNHPDMVTFTPDGTKILVANEGEVVDTSTDGNGSVSVINVPSSNPTTFVNWGSATNIGLGTATTISNHGRVRASFNISQDGEPEYIAVSEDSTRAYVSLQENNALAIINLESDTLVGIFGLGRIDHNQPGFRIALQRNQGTGVANVTSLDNVPFYGLPMPDGIDVISKNGKTYVLTANEGDDRDDFISPSDRVNLSSMPAGNATIAPYQATNNVYRGTRVIGDVGITGGVTTEPTLFGTRSFSVYEVSDSAVTRRYDSGEAFESYYAKRFPNNFNVDNAANTPNGDRNRSKGPEPESIRIGTIGSKTLAFVGIERMSGIMVYDITNPESPDFVEYLTNRNFSETPALGQGGDLGPEGLTFIPASDSPNGKPLLITANEVSGTISVWQINN